jgi:hypothetical protein
VATTLGILSIGPTTDPRKTGLYSNNQNYAKPALQSGMNDQQEYFAEATESYFGTNDFYPFVRAELKQHDPAVYQLIERVWFNTR